MPLLRSFGWSATRVLAVPLTAVAVGVAATMPTSYPSSSTSPTAVAGPQPGLDGPGSTALPIRLASLATDPVEEVERLAIEAADDLGAVPSGESDALCPRGDLAVRWSPPDGFVHGAFVTPVGPAPGPASIEVNGVVVCGTSTWAFMGFEARRGADGGWEVTGVPYVEEGDGHPSQVNLDADPEVEAPATPPAVDPSPSAPTATVERSEWLAGLGTIEPYAAYEPQTTCSPSARPGTVALRDVLLGTYPATRNLGITRGCHIGGRSEHKEGRAFDWGAYVSRPVEQAAVERYLTQLFATDADGNTHALARRLGVMYVIWNGRIWSSNRAGSGWRSYNGPSPHTDHIHISLGRAGAEGRTSFHTLGLAATGVLGLVPPGSPVPGDTDGSGTAVATFVAAPKPPGAKSGPVRDRAPDAAAGDAGQGSTERADRAAERAAERAERAAARDARKAAEREARAERGAERDQAAGDERAERDAERGAAREARKAAQREARAQRQAERDAARDARKAAEREARTQRQAEQAAERAERMAARDARQAAEREGRVEREAAQREARAQRRAERDAERAERASARDARQAAEREARAEREQSAREAAEREAAEQDPPVSKGATVVDQAG